MKFSNFFQTLNKSNSLKRNCFYTPKRLFCNQVVDQFLNKKRNFANLPSNKTCTYFKTNEISIHQALLSYIESVKEGIPAQENSEREVKRKIINIKQNQRLTSVDLMGIFNFDLENTMIDRIRSRFSSLNNLNNSKNNNNKNKNPQILRIFFDGGCATKERISFFGATMYLEEENILKLFGNIGPQNTNNTAEYTGLIMSLIPLYLCENELSLANLKVRIYSDSELVCKQMNRRYRVNSPHILILNAISQKLYKKIKNEKEILHIRRMYNEEADELGNQGRMMNTNTFEIYY